MRQRKPIKVKARVVVNPYNGYVFAHNNGLAVFKTLAGARLFGGRYGLTREFYQRVEIPITEIAKGKRK